MGARAKTGRGQAHAVAGIFSVHPPLRLLLLPARRIFSFFMLRKLLQRPWQTACTSSVLLHGVLFLLFVAWMTSRSVSPIAPVPEEQAAVVDPDMFHIEIVPEAPPAPNPPAPRLLRRVQ